ncbi:MAG: NAD(P)/FAD-dependent oxidoreductase [Saprospirales bacterium]|nr:NAD(P)/FAD-dependent oxidoreductase [Saprospirales bacterium]
MKYDTIIVGGGIAGLTAAAYLARAGQSVALFEKQAKAGGLVQSFVRNGVLFDAGLRSIENSGIVFPMLKQLGIEIEFVRSNVSIGIADQVLKLEDRESLKDYEAFLVAHFPENKDDIHLIIREVRKTMEYMDVLYGIDNPAFIDFLKDRSYLFKVMLPWMLKFILTIRKINRLKEPVEEYLKRFTKSQALIDIIAQHFFQKTPTSFALGYFSLYLDYHYPKGGTAVLIDKMVEFIQKHGGAIHTSTPIERLDPEQKYVLDHQGNHLEYDQLIWAADLKQLYRRIQIEDLNDQGLREKIEKKRAELKDLKGGDSVYTAYYIVAENRDYFSNICTGHFFYTPSKKGLSTVDKDGLDRFLNAQTVQPEDTHLKNEVKKYLQAYCALNTFEIAIPALRDPDLAPEGQTGLVVSLLFDYQLAKKIEEAGWTGEIKDFLEQCFIDILDQRIFPGIKGKIVEHFSSTPLTIEHLTRSTDGAITGWAFTNPHMPVVDKMLKVAQSVETGLPSIYQAGQWTYSPSGLPIAILTGKLAADKVLKKRKGKA